MAKLPPGEIVLERIGRERVRQSQMLRLFLFQRSGPGPLDRVFTRFVPLLAAVLLNGCSSVGYYGQLA
ncbi:MAG: aminopeptidase, partial [Pseudomonas capeferrum]